MTRQRSHPPSSQLLVAAMLGALWRHKTAFAALHVR